MNIDFDNLSNKEIIEILNADKKTFERYENCFLASHDTPLYNYFVTYLERALVQKAFSGEPEELLVEIPKITNKYTQLRIINTAFDFCVSNNNESLLINLVAVVDESMNENALRILLKYYAETCDIDKYNKTLKRCDKRKSKYELSNIQYILIGKWAQKYGYHSTVDQFRDSKNVCSFTLHTIAKQTSEDSIIELIFDEYSNGMFNTWALVDICYEYLVNKTIKNKTIVAYLPTLFKEIKNIDIKNKVPGSNFGERQMCLFNLSYALIQAGFQEESLIFIKQLSNPKTKKQLLSMLDT